MKKKVQYLLEFYGTIGIPLIYFLGLYFISLGNTLSVNSVVRLISVLATFLGIILWILSYLSLKRSFGVLPRKQAATKRGVYRFLGHPMYIAIIMTYLGLSLANQSVAGLSFTILFLVPLLIVRARLEEKYLS